MVICRSVFAQRLNGTNLLLIVASKPTSECDAIRRLPQAPQKIDVTDYTVHHPEVCDRPDRLRVRPTQCFNTDKPVSRHLRIRENLFPVAHHKSRALRTLTSGVLTSDRVIFSRIAF